MSSQQSDLRDCEHHRQGKYAKNLESGPGTLREAPPHHLVQTRKRNEEHQPSDGKLAPTFIREMNLVTEQGFDQRATSKKSGSQHSGEEQIDDRRLDVEKARI